MEQFHEFLVKSMCLKKVSLIFCLCDIDCYEMVYIGLMVFYLACFLQHAIWKEKVVHCWNISRKWFLGAPVWIFVKGTLLLEFFFVHTETHKPIFVVNSKRINEKVEIRFYLKLMPLCLLPGNMQMKKEVQSSNTEGKFFILFLVRTCTLPWNI